MGDSRKGKKTKNMIKPKPVIAALVAAGALAMSQPASAVVYWGCDPEAGSTCVLGTSGLWCVDSNLCFPNECGYVSGTGIITYGACVAYN